LRYVLNLFIGRILGGGFAAHFLGSLAPLLSLDLLSLLWVPRVDEANDSLICLEVMCLLDSDLHAKNTKDSVISSDIERPEVPVRKQGIPVSERTTGDGLVSFEVFCGP
jgi:hypothetical protein